MRFLHPNTPRLFRRYTREVEALSGTVCGTSSMPWTSDYQAWLTSVTPAGVQPQRYHSGLIHYNDYIASVRNALLSEYTPRSLPQAHIDVIDSLMHDYNSAPTKE